MHDIQVFAGGLILLVLGIGSFVFSTQKPNGAQSEWRPISVMGVSTGTWMVVAGTSTNYTLKALVFIPLLAVSLIALARLLVIFTKSNGR
ncbi:hypothetical protein ACFYTC_38535 [Actinomadura nitritigenes]|uniref:hypothetical protein n=1 Tax=Actinomadura nitritigenes TaxID=134602 RepID=UPI0036C2895F